MELVPPGCHRLNAVEVALWYFKAHFLGVLAGTAADFPSSLWDRLVPQEEITVKLLRQSNATPNASAYAHLSGPFEYNKMPLASMGCTVQVYKKTDKRGVLGFTAHWMVGICQHHLSSISPTCATSRGWKANNSQTQHSFLTRALLTPQSLTQIR